MDELDLTEKTPRAFETGPFPSVTMPILKIDIEPLATERAADGTRSRLPTAPPPIPVRATRVSKPPPIPTAAFEKAEPEPEIPMTIEPVVTRRSGTIPPPIPSMARRSPTVPPLDAPSVVIAPTDDAADVASLWPDVSPSATLVRSPAPVESVATGRESAAVATLPEWPILEPAPAAAPAATLVAAPPPLPVLASPAEWLHPKVATPPLAGADPEIASTTYYERTQPPRTAMNPRHVAGAVGGGIAVIAIIALAMHGGGDEPKLAKPEPAKSEPAKRTHTHAITKAPAIALGSKTAAATTPAPAVPEAANAAVPAPTARTLAEVPISSWPQGATVTLVDDGNAKIIGRTPVTASLDPARSYDVVLAVSGRPTTVRHLDPSTTHELAVDLDPDPAPPVTHGAPKHVTTTNPTTPAVSHAPTAHVATAAPVTNRVATAPTAAPVTNHVATAHTPAAPPRHVATTAPPPASTKVAPARPTQVARSGKLAPVDFDSPTTGMLQIQTKPPCEIVIDGKPTHLVTPQRSIALSPGAHAVTLINVHDKIKKTVAVHIEAKRATMLAHDFTTAQ